MNSKRQLLVTLSILSLQSIALAQVENAKRPLPPPAEMRPLHRPPLAPPLKENQAEPLKAPMGVVWTDEQRACVESIVGRPSMGTRPPSVAQMKIALADCGVAEPDGRAPAAVPPPEPSMSPANETDSQNTSTRGVK